MDAETRMLTVALCQLRSGADVAANLALVQEQVARAAGLGARLVVLPEATMVRFGVDPRPVAELLDGRFAEGVREAARRHGVLVVVGMFTPAGDGRVHNTVLATDGAGTEARYDKVHLYDAFEARESEHTAPGEQLVVMEALGTRIGLATCYDVRFAHQFSELGCRGAEVVCLPTAWADGPRKTEQWELLVRARAMDAQAYLLGCDQAYVPQARTSFGVGHSLVAGPLGEVVAGPAGREPHILLHTLDLAEVTRARRAVPLLDDHHGRWS